MAGKQNNPAIETEVTNNNTQNMNNFIDFTSVCGEESVAQTAKVDQQVVNDLFNAFMNIPQEVIVKFKNDNGYLKIVVNMNHREKFFRSYETYADAKLVESVIGSMRGTMMGALNVYKAEEHPIEFSEVDPRIDIFKQFINSRFKCHFDADFTTNKGDRYMCATFRIGYRKEVKFCLKRTEEIETIINDAIKAVA
jgi:hypothetical protein